MNPAGGTQVSHRIESATTRSQPHDESAVSRIELPELEAAVGWSQLQLVSNRRIESAANRVQPPELESTGGWNQPQLIFSGQNYSQL